MGLVVAALIIVAGCYDPSLKDCTISCATDDDCAHGQACAAGGWCAAQGSSCSGIIDAPTVPTDTSVAVDAAVTPDANGNATLRVVVLNKGQVNIPTVGMCVSTDNGQQGTTCTFSVNQGTKLTAMAMMTAGGKPFDKWNDLLCKSQGASCMFTVLPFTQIQAEFQ